MPEVIVGRGITVESEMIVKWGLLWSVAAGGGGHRVGVLVQKYKEESV